MHNTILILAETPEHAEQWKKLLDTARYDVIAAGIDYAPDLDVINQLFLVILCQASHAQSEVLTRMGLPGYIPALVPIEQEESLQSVTADDRLIDHYFGPFDASGVRTRVDFLRRVAKLNFEHASYLETHAKFLDWFTSRDGLTGLYNRNHFNKTLDREYHNALEQGTDISILIIDIDYFNEINKSCGQNFGDFVINEMSARLTSATNRADSCFRLSGGDFVVLMPGTELLYARKSAEELQSACSGKPFNNGIHKREVTLSIGIASLATHQPASADEFVNMAETALFKAKADGRNRVYIYAPIEGSGLDRGNTDFDNIKVTINRVLEKTRNSAISSLQLLARDIAGPQHREHIRRVTHYTELLCKDLGLPPAIIQTLQNAIILYTSIRHLIHNNLLSKKGLFTAADRAVMEDFPYKLSEVAEIFDYFSQERLIMLTRSENFDGSGYPEGLRGSEIPLGARIISVVDSFAAMEAERPHRRKLSSDTILHELKKQAGKQFDPFLVLKLLDIIEHNGLLDISKDEISEVRAELLKIQAQAI